MSNPTQVAEQWRLIQYALDGAESRAIDATGRSVGQSKVFAFARIVRGWEWCGKDGKPMEPTGEQVAEYVELTYERHCKTELGLPNDISFWDAGFIKGGDPRGEFLLAWNDIRIADGKGLLESAEKNATGLRLKPCRAHSAKYCDFISFSGHLQQLRRAGQTIQLPVELLAERFQVSPRMISQYRRWAVQDGILLQIKPANSYQKLATEFEFQVDQFDWKSGRQIPVEPSVEPSIESNVIPSIERTGELAAEPGSSSTRSSTSCSDIGFSGVSQVLQSSHIEPDGCAVEHHKRQSNKSSTPDNDLKKLSKSILTMSDEQFKERRALLMAQADELKKRGIR